MRRYFVLMLVLTHLYGEMNMATAAENRVFSKLDEVEMSELERELVYLYGATNPEEVAPLYVNSLKELEALGISASQDKLKAAMVPHLQKAYEVVRNQTGLEFDTLKAAEIECSLILAQTNQESFEKIRDIMISLYETVFRSQSEDIVKAAMLRTFLYQYKVKLVNSNVPLTQRDRKVLISMARESEELLNGLTAGN